MASSNPVAELQQRFKVLVGQMRVLLPLLDQVKIPMEKLDAQSPSEKEIRKTDTKVDEKNVCEGLKAKQKKFEEKLEELEKLKEELEKGSRAAAVRVLREVGADLEKADSEGRTPLHRAAERGDTRTVQVLLDAGCDVNAADPDGCTPLYLTAEKGHRDACRVLLAAGARLDMKERLYGWTALHLAAYHGHRAVCQLLLAAGARPNEPDDADLWTPLHQAASEGHAPVVQLLLQHGAEPGMRNREGQTALDLVLEWKRKHAEVAAMLQA
ncbi:ankyrin repeat and protein kinase domain-containing protein 1-like [Periplaneta americana]|uniref:ankyrin repeat and protein kinase domain-containing protein 1-like n=1 Tax=Periplaneta americana TaxID=6978 RepID=UPI0037E76F32